MTMFTNGKAQKVTQHTSIFNINIMTMGLKYILCFTWRIITEVLRITALLYRRISVYQLKCTSVVLSSGD